jgi:integrase
VPPPTVNGRRPMRRSRPQESYLHEWIMVRPGFRESLYRLLSAGRGAAGGHGGVLGVLTLLDEVGPGSTHRLAAYVVVSLLSGVRTEEARTLTWANVELDAGTVAVFRSVRAKGDTKTRKSRRILQLPKRAVESLKEHRKRQATERLQAGQAWCDHGLVFCREDGTELDRWQVRREFAGISRAAGLGDQWAPRELRHSFVSILSASGMRIEDISDLVGHSGTSVTEALYRHEIRPALSKGATAMDKILSKKRRRPPSLRQRPPGPLSRSGTAISRCLVAENRTWRRMVDEGCPLWRPSANLRGI